MMRRKLAEIVTEMTAEAKRKQLRIKMVGNDPKMT